MWIRIKSELNPVQFKWLKVEFFRCYSGRDSQLVFFIFRHHSSFSRGQTSISSISISFLDLKGRLRVVLGYKLQSKSAGEVFSKGFASVGVTKLNLLIRINQTDLEYKEGFSEDSWWFLSWIVMQLNLDFKDQHEDLWFVAYCWIYSVLYSLEGFSWCIRLESIEKMLRRATWHSYDVSKLDSAFVWWQGEDHVEREGLSCWFLFSFITENFVHQIY